MFRWLTKSFASKNRAHVPDFEDAMLGRMQFVENRLWEAHVTIAGKRIGFSIKGQVEPNAVLLAHARDIVQNFADFESMISAFLAEEGRKMMMTPDQVRKLQIAQVSLCWPERPDDGMIYFDGLEQIGVWRCDYINRKPKRLGFDN
jgi:hypothetical protein